MNYKKRVIKTGIKKEIKGMEEKIRKDKESVWDESADVFLGLQ